MPYNTKINVDYVNAMVSGFSNIGNEQTRDMLIRPRKVMEFAIDLCTCGGVRRQLSEQYDTFVKAMTEALPHIPPGESAANIPERLEFSFSGFSILFVRPAESNNTGEVSIEVSKNGESSTSTMNHQKFCRTVAVLLVRRQYNLPYSSTPLTDRGGINLKELNLCGFDLHGASLKKADLSRADLYKANLVGANLAMANLSRANLMGADLSKANLIKADLDWANLSWTNFSRAKLMGAYMCGANLCKTNLNMAELRKAVLRGTNLSRADLSGADLRSADLSWANLSEANLTGANLRGADLHGANLSRANLRGANLNGANLRGTNLKNLSPTDALLSFPSRWSSETLHAFIDHINNNTHTSLLTMMDSIDKQYTDVKLRMVHELMASLAKNVSSDLLHNMALPLLDVLSKVPYTDDANIVTWLDTVCTGFLGLYNKQALPPWNKGVFNHSVRVFISQQEKMFSHNSAFIQLIDQTMSQSKGQDCKNRAARLYNSYLENKRVNPYLALDDFGGYGTHKVDWKDGNAANYLLFSAQTGPSGNLAMLCSQNTLRGILNPDPSHPVWDQFYLYETPNKALSSTSIPQEILFSHHFPVFLGSYLYAQNQTRFGLLLEVLNLGDMHPLFVSATRAATSTIKLVDTASQQKLGHIFNPILISTHHGENTLKDEHYDQIIEKYELSSASHSERAKTLLSLAVFFTKYSSSALFGNSNESPEMLRRYAHALMEKAHTLDASLFKCAEKGVDLLPDWKNRLLGLNKSFSCSSILFSIMYQHIRQQHPDILNNIIPPAWS